MRTIILSLILVFGIGISFGQTDDGMLVVTVIDEDGNVVELPSVPHVPPVVTENSPPPPTLNDELIPPPPTNLIITNEKK